MTPDAPAEFLDRTFPWRSCVIAVFALQAILVLKHEPWLDEWQALQISIQSPDLKSLLENLRYEGHPPLWYVILRGAAEGVPPGWVLAAVQLPIALAIQSLILFRLPLARVQRLLFAMNPYVLIDYGAISRSLGLGVLLLMTTLLFRQRKVAWLSLACLPMADFLFGVLSIGCVLLFWREKRIWISGVALWIVASLLAALSVRPAPDMIPALWLNGPLNDGLTELARLGALVLPFGFTGGHLAWNQLPPVGAALAAGVLFSVTGFRLLRADKWSLGLFGSFLAVIFLFSMMIYPLAIRHVSLALVALILLVATRVVEDQGKSVSFNFLLSFGAVCGFAIALTNLLWPFDTAAQAASFITTRHLDSRHWVAFPDSRAQGVSALTGTEFERLERDCTESFIRWNYRSRVNSPRDLERELARIADRSGSFFLLTDFDLASAGVHDPAAYRLLKYVPAGFDGQSYYLFQFKPDLATKSERLPQCPPPRLPLRIMPASH